MVEADKGGTQNMKARNKIGLYLGLALGMFPHSPTRTPQPTREKPQDPAVAAELKAKAEAKRKRKAARRVRP